MTARPHRFLQYLQALVAGWSWFEIPAIDGGAPGPRTSIITVIIEEPEGAARGIKSGVRFVTKQVVRLLYLTPLLVIAKFAVQGSNRELSDLFTFGFVLLVVVFFVLLNLYLVISVVVHFVPQKRQQVLPPFEEGGDPFGRGIQDFKGDVVRVRGTIEGIGDALIGSTQVVRDLWSIEGSAPWRLTEAVDFAVVPHHESGPPVILHLKTAPMILASTEKETVEEALRRFTPGMTSAFDVGPATSGTLGRGDAQVLTLAEGDEVEIIGMRSGTISNVQRFELGGRIRALKSAARAADPYRGAGGEEGLLVTATPDAPLWIRKD